MEFYGRDDELLKLDRLLSRGGPSAALVFGRRRVGKSELVKQSLRRSAIGSIYYECKQTTEANNVQSLAALVAEKYGYPRLAFSGVEELLGFLFERAEQEPLALVLDEYPYLRSAVKGMDSVLQALLDGATEGSRLKLVLCGSFIDVMKSLLDEHNPLYGRFDLVIDLKPMDYLDSSLFYPNFPDEDKVRIFSVLGGVPYYNRLVDDSLSVRDNIIELLASPGARLENEVAMFLRSEMSKIANANEVFEALAAGAVKFSDILAQSHVPSSPTLSDVLDRLVRMQMVEKVAPINGGANRRRAGYRISDNLSAFYYRYVFRYSSQMSVMEPTAFFERFVAKDFEEQYVRRAFEEICKQYLVRKNRLGQMDEPFFLIGKYYYDDPVAKRNGEFDVVTEDARGYTAYEVKFRGRPLSRELIEGERSQVDASPLSCYRYGFFSRSGFDCQPAPDEVFVSLAELYR